MTFSIAQIAIALAAVTMVAALLYVVSKKSRAGEHILQITLIVSGLLTIGATLSTFAMRSNVAPSTAATLQPGLQPPNATTQQPVNGDDAEDASDDATSVPAPALPAPAMPASSKPLSKCERYEAEWTHRASYPYRSDPGAMQRYERALRDTLKRYSCPAPP